MDGFSSYGSGTTQNDSYKGFQTEEINVADIPTPKSSNTTQGSSSGGICASAQPVKYDIPVQPEPKPAETTYENYQGSNTMAAYSFADAPYYTAINTLARTNTPPPPGVDYEEFRASQMSETTPAPEVVAEPAAETTAETNQESKETDTYHGPSYSYKHPVQELYELRGTEIDYVLEKEVPRGGLWMFTMSVEIEGTKFIGEGKSKKQAKAEAAKHALLKLYNILSIETRRSTSWNKAETQSSPYEYSWGDTNYNYGYSDYGDYSYYGYEGYDYGYDAESYDWGYDKPSLSSHMVDYQIGVKYNRFGERIGSYDPPDKAQFCSQNAVQFLYQYHPDIKFEFIDEFTGDSEREKLFVMGCMIKGGYFKGIGANKKEAKSECAQNALAVMHNVHIVPESELELYAVGKKTIKGSFIEKENTRLIKTPLRDLFEIRPHLEFFFISEEDTDEGTIYTYAVEMDEVLYEGEGFDEWEAKQAAAFQCIEALKSYLNPDYEKEKQEAKAKELEVKEYKREKAKAKAKARREKEDQDAKKSKLQEEEDEERQYWNTIATLRGAPLHAGSSPTTTTTGDSTSSLTNMAGYGAGVADGQTYSADAYDQAYSSGDTDSSAFATGMGAYSAGQVWGTTGSTAYDTSNQAYSTGFGNVGTSSTTSYSTDMSRYQAFAAAAAAAAKAFAAVTNTMSTNESSNTSKYGVFDNGSTNS